MEDMCTLGILHGTELMDPKRCFGDTEKSSSRPELKDGAKADLRLLNFDLFLVNNHRTFIHRSNRAGDRGCSTNPNGVTGTTYTSQFFSRPTFKIYCDANAPNNPLQSLFVGTFDDCIDACAFYSNYTTGNFPNVTSTTNTTCVGVSYIPDWTNRTTAMSINAPGNCYLKPGPQTAAALTAPQGGGIVHAAILSQSDK
ncbi:hypothetical protein FHL15_005527 [Xylaria flabelliformis]|uniref:Uncharacterized protein n=1 Tax=Xylaria flabelliformis TaxID=2512241 RepID=A0A553I056_9PEZI|nr:hypothetical protein FHL15_005527 [Xylaria flabelliformis]